MYYELTCCVENSVDSNCFEHSEGFAQMSVHDLFFNMGQINLSMDK